MGLPDGKCRKGVGEKILKMENSDNDIESVGQARPLLVLSRAAKKVNKVYAASVVTFFSLRKKQPILFFSLIFLVFVAPLGYYSSSYVYYQYLLTSGEQAMKSRRYQMAKEYFAEYYDYRSDDAAVFLNYVRVLLELGEYDKALTVISELPPKSAATEMAEYWLYLALANVGTNRNDAVLEKINQGLEIYPLDPPLNYFLSAYRLFIEGDAVAANGVLSKINILNIINQTVDNDIRVRYESDLNIARDVISAYMPEQISFNFPPPFRELKRLSALDDRLGFSLPLYAFNSSYSFRLRDFVLQQRGVRLSAEENVRLLRALGALQQSNPAQARRYLLPFQQREDNNLLISILSAYAAFRDGNTATARDVYKEILQRSEDPNHHYFYANTDWYVNGGDIPKNEVIAAYEHLIERQPENLVAASNLAFLKIYGNNLAAARELLTQYSSSVLEDEHILVNTSILDIVDGRLDIAANNLRRFIAAKRGALPARLLLAQIFIRQGKHLEARSVYEEIKQHYQSSVPYLEAAHFYEKRVRWQLMTSELKKAQEIFKDDVNVINELLLANAVAGDSQQVKRLIFFNSGDEEVLSDYRTIVAQAIVSASDTEKENFFTRAWYQAQTEVEKNRVVFFWARSLLDEGRVDEAKSVLHSGVKAQDGTLPARMQALQLRLNSQEKPGFYEIIASAASSLLRDDYKLDVLSRLDIAWAYVYAGEGKMAIDLISSFGEEQKRNKNVLRALKTAYESIGDRENAEKIAYLMVTGKELQENRAAQNENVELITGVDKGIAKRINMAAQEENYPALIQIYTEILEQDKLNRRSPALTYQNRGAIYLVLEEFEKAELDFAQALSQGRDKINATQLASILYNYGYALVKNEKLKESLLALRESVELYGDNVQSLSLLAQVQLANKDYEGLIDTYNELIKFNPRDRNIYLSLAKIYRITGKNQEGINTLLLALKLDANHRQTHILLAELYAIIGDQSNAQKHLDIINRI